MCQETPFANDYVGTSGKAGLQIIFFFWQSLPMRAVVGAGFVLFRCPFVFLLFFIVIHDSRADAFVHVRPSLLSVVLSLQMLRWEQCLCIRVIGTQMSFVRVPMFDIIGLALTLRSPVQTPFNSSLVLMRE